MSASYQTQLRRLVHAMSMPDREHEARGPDQDPSFASQVRMFVDGNLGKRKEKLEKQLEFVASAFDHFDRMVVEFICAEPLAAFGSAVSDGERMLQWLASTNALTPVQRDYVACQRASHEIEELARRERLAYVRFQELSSVVAELLPRLASDHQVRLVLNPTRTWATFLTNELTGDNVDPPTNVLFFASRGEVATAVLELEGQALLNELIDYQPCTLSEWSTLSTWADRDQLAAFCHDLAEMGLIAIQ